MLSERQPAWRDGTGYHPQEQLRRFSGLVLLALERGLERSGLEDRNEPWIKPAITQLQNGMIEVFAQAELDQRRAARNGNAGVDDAEPSVIESNVVERDQRVGDYDERPTAELRGELSERGLARGGSRQPSLRSLSTTTAGLRTLGKVPNRDRTDRTLDGFYKAWSCVTVGYK